MCTVGHSIFSSEERGKVNEVDLIREVQKYPILYDRDTPRFNRTKLREEAWRIIEATLNIHAAECKKRWRSLRDSFIKIHRTRGMQKCRWLFMDHMQFLLPHVEIRSEDSEPDDEMKMKLQPEVTLTVQNCPLPVADDDDAPLAKRAHMDGEDDAMTCPVCQSPSHPDDMFLLSCAPILKRLAPQQNSLARIRIQKLLYELEFGENKEPETKIPNGHIEPVHVKVKEKKSKIPKEPKVKEIREKRVLRVPKEKCKRRG